MSNKRITLRDPAGPYIESFTRAFYAPFTAATGIEIVRTSGGVEPTDRIGAMVRERRYDWDMALISQAAHLQLACDGLLEPVDLDAPDIAAIPARFKSRHFVGNDVYAVVLVRRRDAFAAGRAPESWADLWNAEAFPGCRSLRRHPIDTIEQALLADGVAPDALYPCDLDRALRSLDRIRPHVAEWWPRAARTEELLRTGAVDLCPTSTIRAQAAIDAGAAVEIVWRDNIQSCEGWCIPKGTPRAELCREFIRFVATAERQAAYTSGICSGPTVPAALERVEAGRARLLPTHPDNAAQAVVVDPAYWSRAKDAAVARFERWLE